MSSCSFKFSSSIISANTIIKNINGSGAKLIIYRIKHDESNTRIKIKSSNEQVKFIKSKL